jgi:GNAT superfamily N-acetyltransferase
MTWRIEKLSAAHDTSAFDCGKEPLNRFLHRYALINQKAGSAQTYVVCADKAVAGYYSLAVGSVRHADAPGRAGKGLARHPVPVMILARLAVDSTRQGRGLGRLLLRDALLRTLQAADIAGIRAMLVHAKDDEAKAWYEGFDFEPSPTDPHHLFLLMKAIRAIAGRAHQGGNETGEQA